MPSDAALRKLQEFYAFTFRYVNLLRELWAARGAAESLTGGSRDLLMSKAGNPRYPRFQDTYTNHGAYALALQLLRENRDELRQRFRDARIRANDSEGLYHKYCTAIAVATKALEMYAQPRPAGSQVMTNNELKAQKTQDQAEAVNDCNEQAAEPGASSETSFPLPYNDRQNETEAEEAPAAALVDSEQAVREAQEELARARAAAAVAEAAAAASRAAGGQEGQAAADERERAANRAVVAAQDKLLYATEAEREAQRAEFDRYAETEAELRRLKYDTPTPGEYGAMLGPLDGTSMPPAGWGMAAMVQYTHKATSWASGFGEEPPTVFPAAVPYPARRTAGDQRPLFDAVIWDSGAFIGKPFPPTAKMWVVDGGNVFNSREAQWDKHGVITQRGRAPYYLNADDNRTPIVPWPDAANQGPVVVIFQHHELWERFLRPVAKGRTVPERNTPAAISDRLQRLVAMLDKYHGNRFPVQFIDIEPKKCQDRGDGSRSIQWSDKGEPGSQPLSPEELEKKYPCHDFVKPAIDRDRVVTHQDPMDRYPDTDERKADAGVPRGSSNWLKSVCQVTELPRDIKRANEEGYRMHHMFCEFDDVVMDGLVWYMRRQGFKADRITRDSTETSPVAMKKVWDAMKKLNDRMILRSFIVLRFPQP